MKNFYNVIGWIFDIAIATIMSFGLIILGMKWIIIDYNIDLFIPGIWSAIIGCVNMVLIMIEEEIPHFVTNWIMKDLEQH